MALITEVVADHFGSRDDLHDVVMMLDLKILAVGLSVRMMRDMLLHGSPGSGSSDCDAEEVAAMADGLLAHLGYIGPLIDKLEAQTNPYRRPNRTGEDGRQDDHR